MLFSFTLLGNLLKQVQRNNMLITLELKKMNASFQNLPHVTSQKITKFSTPSFIRACETYFKTLRQTFSVRTLFQSFHCCCFCCCVILIPFCKQQTDYIGKINSTNVRMRATRFMIKALAVVFHKEVSRLGTQSKFTIN